MRKKLAALSVIFVVAMVAAFGVTGSASAWSNAGVYVVTPHSWGWCPASGVAGVFYWDHTSGSQGGDYGDDIVWVPVILNTTNFITVTVHCNASWDSSATYTSFRPTRNGQAWYIGPGGGTWGN